MSVQSIEGFATNTLHLSWKLYEEGVKAVSIQIATDSEFIQNSRIFVVPPTASFVSLDLGAGDFFYRIAAWLPNGRVDWSGIYGPIHIESSKSIPQVSPSTLRINYTQSITNGLRLHTNKIQKGVYWIEFSIDSSFKASNTSYCYTFDSLSSGYADCTQLQPGFQYSIRVCHLDSLPSNSIIQLPVYQTVHKQSAHPLSKRSNTQESAGIKAAEMTLLQEARERPLRFNSHQEYLTYINAKAKNTNTLYKI